MPTREGQLEHLLKKIKDKNLFNENTYQKIYPCGFKPTTIYSIPRCYLILLTFPFDQLFVP